MIMCRKIFFFSDHVYNSENKAGFHYIADILDEDYNVYFITIPFSIQSLKHKDPRIKHIRLKNLFSWETSRYNNIKHMILFSAINYVNRPLIKKFERYYYFSFLYYYLLCFMSKYDILIFESNQSLFLAKRLIQKGYKKIIYRASDNISKYHNAPKRLVECEKYVIRKCLYTFAASTTITKEFKKCSDNVSTLWNYVDTKLFNRFQLKDRFSAVYFGIQAVDIFVLNILIEEFNYFSFHFIGPERIFKGIKKDKNTFFHGLLKPFESSKIINNCSIGLLTYRYRLGFEYIERPVKFLQYVASGLKIYYPSFITYLRNVLSYEPYEPGNKHSIIDSFKKIINNQYHEEYDKLLQDSSKDKIKGAFKKILN